MLDEQEKNGAITLVKDINPWDGFEQDNSKSIKPVNYYSYGIQQHNLAKKTDKYLERTDPELYNLTKPASSIQDRGKYPRGRWINWFYNKFFKVKKRDSINPAKINEFTDSQNQTNLDQEE